MGSLLPTAAPELWRVLGGPTDSRPGLLPGRLELRGCPGGSRLVSGNRLVGGIHCGGPCVTNHAPDRQLHVSPCAPRGWAVVAGNRAGRHLSFPWPLLPPDGPDHRAASG